MTSTRSKVSLLAILIAAANLNSGNVAFAQSGADIPPSLVTPDKVDTRLGTLEFKDGAPSAATVEKLYDTLDFTRASTRSSTATAGRPHKRSARAC